MTVLLERVRLQFGIHRVELCSKIIDKHVQVPRHIDLTVLVVVVDMLVQLGAEPSCQVGLLNSGSEA